MRIQNIFRLSNIKKYSGKVSLYTDFDETLMPLAFDAMKKNAQEEKSQYVDAYNKYFGKIQQYIREQKGNFEISITTGRKFAAGGPYDFIKAYKALIDAGVVFPKIKEVITEDGGDIYAFSKSGHLDTAPLKEKIDTISKATGWKKEKADKFVKESAKEFGVESSVVSRGSSHKLDVILSDSSVINEFFNTLLSKFNKAKIQVRMLIENIKYRTNGEVLESGLGVRVEPLADGHVIRKDFDVKLKLKDAIKHGGYVIAAGDAPNDKEMLNIFNYLGAKNIDSVEKINSLNKRAVEEFKKKLSKLPFGAIFVDHVFEQRNSAQYMDFYNLGVFMQQLQRLFPSRVKIIKKSNVATENLLLDAVKQLIADYKAEKNLFQ